MRRGICLMAIALVLLVGVTGQAADGDPKETAKEAYAKGSRLFSDGQFTEAADEFRRAMKLAPSWKIYYNIGHSEAAAKRYGVALESFQMYLAEAGDQIPSDREQEVFGQIEELKKKVGAVVVKAPDGSSVMVDGLVRGTAPLAGSMMVSAGIKHQVVVTLNDDVLLERSVRVWNGEQVVLEASAKKEVAEAVPEAVPESVPVPAAAAESTAEPTAEPAEQPQQKSTADSKETAPTVTTDLSDEPVAAQKEALPPVVRTLEQKHPLRIVGAVTLAVGTAGLLVGGTTGILATVTAKNLESDCSAEKVCDAATDLDKAKKMAKLTNIFLPAGGAVVVVGLGLLIAGRRLERKEMNVSAMPVMVPNGAGLAMMGRF